ncbi:MAG: phosphoribosylanthranilate isomerase [Myxococcota bacterium]
MSYIKICGVRSTTDLEWVIEAGASAVGLNVWPSSPRALPENEAAVLIAQARGRIETVLVVVDHPEPERLRVRLGADWVQLHGDEAPGTVGARSYKAVGVADKADLKRALSFPGERLLVDAKDPIRRGGTGRRVNASIVDAIAQKRPMILAGGLRPENVAEAIAEVKPWGVDTASGVERSPGIKDQEKVRAFVRAAREAFSARS